MEQSSIGRDVSRLVDVIVVAHNGRGHISDCLRSLADSGTALSAVVVVDNASSDGTPELIREEFPDVRIVRSEVNLGYGGGINLGLKVTSADYLVILNQDLVSGPGWVERVVVALEEQPKYGLATPKILLRSDPDLVNACGNDAHYTGITTCRGYRRRSAEFVESHPVALVSGAAFVARRDVLETLGGMDPLFFMYLEDADLSLRAALAGIDSLCVPAATVIHEFEPIFSSRKIFWLECNRWLILLRLFRARTLLALAPALLLLELLVIGYSLASGPRVLAAKLRSYAWILGRRGRIRTSRTAAQRLRRVSDAELLARFTDALTVDELPGRAPRLVARLVNPFFGLWFGVARRLIRW